MGPRYIRACLALGVCAVLAIAVACCVSACARSHSAVKETADAVRIADTALGSGSASGTVVSTTTHSVDPDDLLSIPASDNIISVDLTSRTSEAAADSGFGNIRLAVKNIEDRGDCGFVFVDMNSGRGLAYNAGEAMYVASAAKAPFVCYVLEEGGLADDERGIARYAIVESDNDSFEALYESRMGSGYPDWMSSFGVVHEDYYGDYYPPMSARSLAAVWAEILRFTQGGSEDGGWFADLLSQTDTSFIRDGLWDTGAEVKNKGGWIVEYGGEPSTGEADSEGGEGGGGGAVLYYNGTYLAVSDAGIIEADGNTYLMAIVTSQPDEGVTEANVSALARALFDARSSL